MKNHMLLWLLLPVLTNCGTLTGFTIDMIKNSKKSNNTTNIINRENQPITFVTNQDVRMHARYNGFVYKTEDHDHLRTSSLHAEITNGFINFPQIGDSLTVVRKNEEITSGLFWNFRKSKTGYGISLHNDESGIEDHIRFSSIKKLTWNVDPIEIQDPNIDQLFMKYDSDDIRTEIALSRLKHLNTNRPKGNMKFTTIGLVVDLVLVAILTAGCISINCFDYSFDFGLGN